jgi:hypothetical protein
VREQGCGTVAALQRADEGSHVGGVGLAALRVPDWPGQMRVSLNLVQRDVAVSVRQAGWALP